MEAYIPALATLVVGAIRNLWFSQSPQTRDKVLPILVVVANLLGQIVAALTADSSVAPDAPGLLAATGVGSLVSLGIHRGLKWSEVVLKRPPK